MNGRIVVSLLCTVALSGAVISCGSSKQPTTQVAQAPVAKAATSGAAKPQAAQNSAKLTPVANEAPVPPKDARYTLFCATVKEVMPGDNVLRANKLKADLIKATGMPGWYVVHEQRQSTIYYGFYRSIDDPKDSKETTRAKADHDKIERLPDAEGNRPFAHAMFMPLDAPDPTAPPEWNLLNAPGYWSVEIAAYKDSPERKAAAVDAVRTARAQGVEAFYFHGETTSSVCIGSWPEEAVTQQDMSMRSDDPNQPILVVPGGMIGSNGQPLSQNQLRGLRDKEGRPLKIMQDELKINDPSIVDTMRRYPFHAVNGLQEVLVGTDPATGQKRQTPVPSALVPFGAKKKEQTASMLTDTGVPQGLPAAPMPTQTRTILTPPPPRPGEGRLKSIGG